MATRARAKAKKEKKQPAKASKEKAVAKRASAETIAKSPTMALNSTARAAIIQDATARLDRIADQMDNLAVDRKNQRARIKALGMKLKAYDFTIKLRDMDGGERTEILDSMEEAGKALGLGKQLQLFAEEQAQALQIETDRKVLRDVSAPKKNGGEKQPKTTMVQGERKDGATLAIPPSQPAAPIRDAEF